MKESGHITQKTPKASDDSSQKKRKATTSPTESTKRARISSDGLYPRPTELDSEVDSTHSERPHNVAAQDVRYTVHISDTKTRTTPDLPPEEDAVSHHLQLMLYHRLLSGLLVNSEATGCASTMTNGTGERVQSLNFADLWRRLSLDPQRPFSNMFIRSARQLLERGKAGAPQFECLDDLVRLWHKAVEDLSVDGVDSTLTLEYSLQTLEGAGDNNPGFASQPQVAPPTPHEKTMDDGILSQESETTLAGTSQGSDTTQVGDEDSESTEMLQTASLPKGLLGVKKFQVDDQRLDAHLRSILRWWHGQRRPKGVTKELERRCECVVMLFCTHPNYRSSCGPHSSGHANITWIASGKQRSPEVLLVDSSTATVQIKCTVPFTSRFVHLYYVSPTPVSGNYQRWCVVFRRTRLGSSHLLGRCDVLQLVPDARSLRNDCMCWIGSAFERDEEGDGLVVRWVRRVVAGADCVGRDDDTVLTSTNIRCARVVRHRQLDKARGEDHPSVHIGQYCARLLPSGFSGEWDSLRVGCVVELAVVVGWEHIVCRIGKVTELDGRRAHRRCRRRDGDVCVELPAFQRRSIVGVGDDRRCEEGFSCNTGGCKLHEGNRKDTKVEPHDDEH